VPVCVHRVSRSTGGDDFNGPVAVEEDPVAVLSQGLAAEIAKELEELILQVRLFGRKIAWLFLRFGGLQLGIRRKSFHGRCLRDEAGATRISPQLSSIQPSRTIVYRPPPGMQDEPNSNLPHFRGKGARSSGAGTRAAGPVPGGPESHPTIRPRGRSSSVARAKIQMNHNGCSGCH